MVTNLGITNVEKLLAGDVAGTKFAKIVVGTDDTPVTGTETALTASVEKIITTVNYLPGGFIQFNATLDAGDPAMVIKEMGIKDDNGNLCYRKVIAPVNKVSGVTYSISYKIKVQ